MPRITLFFIVGIGALLAACAAAPALSPQSVAPYRSAIELSGRISVNYQKDGKNEALSGRFNWRQSAARTDVSLISPLGQTLAMIAVTPLEARLTQGGAAPQAAPDIDSLSARALGWAVPVAGLRDWLQGYAQGADGARFIASPQHASITTSDGWRLHYVTWQETSGAPQPKRIDAERSAGPQAEALALRIVLDAPEQP